MEKLQEEFPLFSRMYQRKFVSSSSVAETAARRHLFNLQTKIPKPEHKSAEPVAGKESLLPKLRQIEGIRRGDKKTSKSVKNLQAKVGKGAKSNNSLKNFRNEPSLTKLEVYMSCKNADKHLSSRPFVASESASKILPNEVINNQFSQFLINTKQQDNTKTSLKTLMNFAVNLGQQQEQMKQIIVKQRSELQSAAHIMIQSCLTEVRARQAEKFATKYSRNSLDDSFDDKKDRKPSNSQMKDYRDRNISWILEQCKLNEKPKRKKKITMVSKDKNKTKPMN